MPAAHPLDACIVRRGPAPSPIQRGGWLGSVRARTCFELYHYGEYYGAALPPARLDAGVGSGAYVRVR